MPGSGGVPVTERRTGRKRPVEPGLFVPPAASQPLAARMRPRTLEEFLGQEHLLGAGRRSAN